MPAGMGTVSRFVTAIDTVSALGESLKVCDALNDHGHWASASTANCNVACVFEAATMRHGRCQPMPCSACGSHDWRTSPSHCGCDCKMAPAGSCPCPAALGAACSARWPDAASVSGEAHQPRAIHG